MKQVAFLTTAAAISLLFISSGPAAAAPATSADLAGKMICWADGNIQAFSVDGRAASRKFTDGKWSVGAHGVRIQVGDFDAEIDFEIQADGTITSEYADKRGNHKGVGKFCKGKPQKLSDLAGKKLCWDGDVVETDFPGGKFDTSDNGDGMYLPNAEGVLSNFGEKYSRFDKVFKGVTQEDLDDGRVVYIGEWPGTDYGVTTAQYCK
jgi:hypothetical protein